MEETAVVEQPVAPVSQEAVAPQDPFALDEASFASLSPEQRAGIDPVLDAWKKKATEEISKRESYASEKYKPLEDKAAALDKLTQWQPFVQWWQTQQKQAGQGATPGQQTAIAQTKPNDFATPQEWQDALYGAAQGDPTKLQEIQARAMSAWASPLVQQLSQKQQYIETQMEMKDLFERHSDAKQLDEIGIDPKTKEGVSLLEMGLDWAEKNKRPLEDGYQLAKRWADQMQMVSQQRAMGMVNDKKQAVTQGPSTSSNTGANVIEVANADELLKKSLEAQLSGEKDVRFVIKGSR